MIVPPREFFQFCAKYVDLLRELEQLAGGTELSESEIRDLATRHAQETGETPGFVAKRLESLRILIATDEGHQYFLVAEPVRALLRYLLEEAKPASTDTVQSYVSDLQKLRLSLSQALDSGNPVQAELALANITQTLRRLHEDVSATGSSVLAEVARCKTDNRPGSIRDKFQRIVWWMEHYVAPMLDIIRVEGAMQATFSDLDVMLRRATVEALVVSTADAERNLRLLRTTRRHALNVFDQCGREIAPLYRSVARSTNLAAGAAFALDRLRIVGPDEWRPWGVVRASTLRVQNAPSDRAILQAVRRIHDHPPEPPPVIELGLDSIEPSALRQRRWLNVLPEEVAAELPVEDLLAWLTGRYPGMSTADTVAGFSTLYFDERFRGRFTAGTLRCYETAEHQISAHPVRLEKA